MTIQPVREDERVPDWTMGDRLRKIRRSAKMTQATFAAALGVSEDTYAAWESDRNKVTDVVAMAKRIKVLTGTPIWWTLDTQEGPHPAGPNGGECAVRDLNPEPAD